MVGGPIRHKGPHERPQPAAGGSRARPPRRHPRTPRRAPAAASPAPLRDHRRVTASDADAETLTVSLPVALTSAQV